LAWELEGNGLKVDTAPTTGQAAPGKNDPKPSRPAKLFAELASKHVAELAEQIPAVAELQNLVGLAVAATLIRRQAEVPNTEGKESVSAERDNEASDKGNSPPPGRWRPWHFLDVNASPIAKFEVPRKTPSLANVRFVKNRFWLFSVSGGVEIDPARLADDEHLRPAIGRKLNDSHQQSTPPADEARWWWD
jgi:hypothetical protein